MKYLIVPAPALGVAAGLLAPCLHAAVKPYAAADSHTVHLFHLDEAAGVTTAVNGVTGGASAIAFDGNPSANHATNPQPVSPIVLGASAFAGFGSAADISAADLGLGLDANASGGFQMGPDNGASPDAILHSSLAGADGSFTLEAMINLPAITGTGVNREIICTDNSIGTRGFQFRVNAGGNLEFNFIGTAPAAITVPIPTSGADAFVPDEWFHVALSYDGATSTSVFYWTRVDPTRSHANAIGTFTTETTLGTVSAPLVFGNEARSASTGVNSAEGLRGRLDEIRISNAVRGAGDFIFYDGGDTDGDGLSDDWELGHFPDLSQNATGDPDGDGFNNLAEFTAGSDPNNIDSVPGDTDGDQLADSWEMTWFGNLAQDGQGDPDNDFNFNEEEETAGTNPTDPLSWPDQEPDTLNDGWEINWFGSITAQNAAGDPDGDTFTNAEEYAAGSDPTDPLSTPDSDLDGLSDGWELTHFRVGTEDRATTLARQDGAGDPDQDGYSNEAEETAGTDPANALSKPSDLDSDGLIDSWEMANFTDLDEVATGDPDGDTFTNLQEQLAGSDPNSAASIPTDIDGDGTPDANEAFHPYTADATTLHLWHLDEIDQPAADSGSQALTLRSAANGARLWAPSLAGFRTGLDPSNGRGTTTGGVLSALPLVDGTADDTTLTYAGADGAFTFEAIVRIDFDPANPPNPASGMQIVTGDGDVAANRIWQFRILPTAGAPVLQFININAEVNVQTLAAAIPTSGVNAIVQGSWYHVAVSYNGSENTADNLKLYWTALNPANTQANAIGGGQMTVDLASGTPDFTIGNEGRATGGSSDSFAGVVDEVRISSVARTAGQFLFTAGSAGDSDGDGMPDAWENANFGNLSQGANDDFDRDGTENLAEYRLGLDPKNGGSRFSAVSHGATVEWRGAAGLSFKIQRSTTLDLNSWSDLTTVTGVAGANQFTDPSPPAGRAFYRVVLNP